MSIGVMFAVWVSYPLKQGLKRSLRRSHPSPDEGLSQLSIKTRIETYRNAYDTQITQSLSQLSIKTRIETGFFLLAPGSCRGSLSQLSIKTRIETYLCSWSASAATRVWVSYPLKQGLKLVVRIFWAASRSAVWVSYPLKQGLKLQYCFLARCSWLPFESAIH